MVIKCWLHSAAICLFSITLQPSLLEPTLRFQQLDWERPTTERKQVRLGNFLLIHIYWWPHGWAGAHQGVGGLIFFFSQIQWNPRTKFHPHTHQPFLICMGMPPCHSWPEGEMVGKSSHLEHLRTGRTPTNIYKNRKFLHIWLFFFI